MDASDTIAAVATAPGIGALAVVRLSGDKAFPIVEKIFSKGKENEPYKFISHRATHGYVLDPFSYEVIDEVVVVPYKAPRSYTGQDLIEISCHGGYLISQDILSAVLKLGARLAQPGEFTKRAFLSGRIDLTQAEAVLDLIQAKTGRQGRLSISALAGQLGNEIRMVRLNLLEILSAVAAGIDFPEEVGETPISQISLVVGRSISRLKQLSYTARSGRFLREGLRLSIVGRPNAGKSSLLNQLLKFERALVTDVPGTTRDSLEELLDVNGIPVILVDTAGIRLTDDQVELMGIERTRLSIAQSDLILLVIDLLEGWGTPEEEIFKMLDSRPVMLVGNKIDLASGKDIKHNLHNKENFCGCVYTSAKTGAQLEDLTKAIEQFVFRNHSSQEGGPSLNMRQSALCQKAIEALVLVEKTLASGLPQDCLAVDLKSAVDALSEICGEAVSEEVVSDIFANFCVGK